MSRLIGVDIKKALAESSAAPVNHDRLGNGVTVRHSAGQGPYAGVCTPGIPTKTRPPPVTARQHTTLYNDLNDLEVAAAVLPELQTELQVKGASSSIPQKLTKIPKPLSR